ncbi:divalent-cation tolerance protein CutA [Chitinibacter tainanensis]|uniref:divalent-cation tolerance protein CutA n=1 Tax=Chitinibacter tainanensis TaxID=230667 RepID=UPI0003FFC126|nr:divalent-cation tolerance protein CutA [Chitinibacter tainanensis]
MNAPSESLVVWCNCPDEASATTLAQGLLAGRLAACVNLLPSVKSIYHWHDGVETSLEVPLMIKTTRAAYPALEAWLLAHHPYEIPEIIALPIVAGSASYLAWLAQETQ